MSEPQTSHAGLSPEESTNLVDHPPVSRLAVASVVLGLLSVAAVSTPVALCVPVAAVSLALVALRALARQDSDAMGRKAAWAGLAMGLAFGAWGLTRYVGTQQLLYRQARQRAEQWLELVRDGRLPEAYQLHLREESRQPPDADLEAIFRTTPERALDEAQRDLRNDFDGFFQQRPLEHIVAIGRRGTLRFAGNLRTEPRSEFDAMTQLVTQRFAIDYEEEEQPRTLSFQVTMARRHVIDSGEVRWHVEDVAPSDADQR